MKVDSFCGVPNGLLEHKGNVEAEQSRGKHTTLLYVDVAPLKWTVPFIPTWDDRMKLRSFPRLVIPSRTLNKPGISAHDVECPGEVDEGDVATCSGCCCFLHFSWGWRRDVMSTVELPA